MEKSDLVLLSEAKSGNHDARESLFWRYVRLVEPTTKYVCRLIKKDWFLDELTSEAQLILWRKICDYEPDRNMTMTSFYRNQILYGLRDYSHRFLHQGFRASVKRQKKEKIYFTKVADPEVLMRISVNDESNHFLVDNDVTEDDLMYAATHSNILDPIKNPLKHINALKLEKKILELLQSYPVMQVARMTNTPYYHVYNVMRRHKVKAGTGVAV